MSNKITHTVLTAGLLALSASAAGTPGEAGWPHFADVIPGQWTMNYEGALAASKADGKDVLLLFAGQWCPYCRALKDEIFSNPTWQAAVADKYLVRFDFEQRAGTDSAAYPTLLRTDADYQAEFGFTPQQAFDRQRANYTVQNLLAFPENGASSVLSQALIDRYTLAPGTMYLGFPTLIYMKGAAGANPVSVGRTVGFSSGTAVSSRVNTMNNALAAAKPEFLGMAAPALNASTQAAGTLASGSRTHYYRFTPAAGAVMLAKVQASGGSPVMQLFSAAVPSAARASGPNFYFTADGGSYVLRLNAASGTVPYTLTLLNVSAPNFTNPSDNTFSLVAGVAANITLPVANLTGGTLAVKVAAGRLPAGLKAAVSGGNVTITGTPSKAAEPTRVTLQLSAVEKTNGRTTTLPGGSLEITLSVRHFSTINPTLPGVYTGWIGDPAADNAVAGLITATVSGTGRVGLKWEADNQTFTVSSGAWTEVAGNVFRRVVAAKKGAITYQMDFKIEGGVVSGSWTSSVRATPCAVFGGRNTWGKSRPASAYEGYYTALLPPGTATTHPAGAFGNTPRGYGFITFTVASAGTVRYSGRLADGTTLSGTSALLEDGALCWIPVYKALYARTGSFGALLAVQRGASPAANTVSLAKAGWIYNGKRTALHADAFRMRGMDAADTGGWYDKRQNLAGHYLGKYGFTAANPGIPYVDASGTFALSAALVPDKLAIVANGAAGLVKLDANEARATLSASRATGLASGKFNLVYDLPGKPAKNVSVPWRGVLTPSAACGLGGAGYYLLPDKTLQKPFNAHKFSFPVEIQGL